MDLLEGTIRYRESVGAGAHGRQDLRQVSVSSHQVKMIYRLVVGYAIPQSQNIVANAPRIGLRDPRVFRENRTERFSPSVWYRKG
jgi:hypothetical protein